MTIGLEEAKRRNHMTPWCSHKGQCKRCHGYYVKSVQPWGRELDFCMCECHSTRKSLDPPRTGWDEVSRLNPGVSGEGDSS